MTAGMAVGMVGCGPSVSVPSQGAGSSTGGDGSGPVMTSGSSATTPTPDPPPPTTLTTASPSTTTSPGTTTQAPTTSGSSSSGWGDEGSSGLPPPCQCDSTDVAFEEVIEGRSAAAAMQPLSFTLTPMRWVAFEDSPVDSPLEVQLSYSGGPVAFGHGGVLGCDFIPTECPTGFTFDVQVQLRGGDFAMGSFETELNIPDPDSEFPEIELRQPNVLRSTFEGRLGEDTLYDEDGELAGTALLFFSLIWTPEGELSSALIRALPSTQPDFSIAVFP